MTDGLDLSDTAAVLGLVVHPRHSVAESVATVVEWASAHSVDVVAREADREAVSQGVRIVSDERFLADVTGIISLGGDGTMLGALRLVAERPVPVLGVNHGHLGFLVEIEPTELDGALARVVSGDFTIEAHGCLRVESADGTELATSTGFNDIVFARRSRHGAVSLDLSVDGQQYGYYRADAVIVSTPIGSTAYNYSAGGPVVSPAAPSMVLTPVAPMAGVSRPVVIGPSESVTFRVVEGSAEIALDVDGTAAATVGVGAEMTVRFQENASQVVRLDTGVHSSRSRVKLSLLDLPLREDQLLDLIPDSVRGRFGHRSGTMSGWIRPEPDAPSTV